MIYKKENRKYFALHEDYIIDYFTYGKKFIIPAHQPFLVSGILEDDGYSDCDLVGFGYSFPISSGYFLEEIDKNQEDKMRGIVRYYNEIRSYNSFAVKIKNYIDKCEKMLEYSKEIEVNERFLERAKKEQLIDYIKDTITLLKSNLSHMKYEIYHAEMALERIKD